MCGNNVQSVLHIIRHWLSQHEMQMQTSCINGTLKEQHFCSATKVGRADAKELWRKAKVVENISFLSANRMAMYVCQQKVTNAGSHT